MFNVNMQFFKIFLFLCSLYIIKSNALCGKKLPYDMSAVCHYPKSFMDSVESKMRRQNTLIDKSVPCSPTETQEVVDFVIVGSGVGSVVARRLAEANFTVLLIEAGGPASVGTQIPGMYFQYNGDSKVDWNFHIEKSKIACLSNKGICVYPRGKVMGGTSILNGMMYMRGYPQDFNEMNLPNWDWQSVLPFYLRSENNLDIGTYADAGHHARGGYLTVSRFHDYPKIADHILDAAANLGYATRHDLNGVNRTGFSLAQAMNRNGERLSTARAFIYDIKNPTQNGRLQVRANAMVTKILFEGKKAVGVQYEIGDEVMKIKARKEVVLSAGTIQSPQLLMVSGVGDEKELEKFKIPLVHNSPEVGKNFKNHGSVSVAFRVKNELGTVTMNKDTLDVFLHKRKGPLRSTGLSQLTGFIWTKPVNDLGTAPDLQVFFNGYLANCSLTGSSKELVDKSYPYRLITMTPTMLRPFSVGRITLRSADPKQPPKIYANLLKNSSDIEMLLVGIKKVLELANTKPLSKLIERDSTPIKGCSHLKEGSDDYWRCYIRWETNPENHQVGTCRMGNDGKSVTNERLRVNGVENLRVIDSSVLPNVPHGNLQAPAIMIAEKGAHMIIEDYRN